MASYNKKTVDRIVALIAEDVHTMGEICKIVGISRAVFYKWKNEKPAFAEQLEDAEDARYEKLVLTARNSLKKKLEGYTTVETKIVYTVTEAEGEEPELKIKQYEVREKHRAPEMAAIAYVLGSKSKTCKLEPHRMAKKEENCSSLVIHVADQHTKEQLQIMWDRQRERQEPDWIESGG